MPTIPAMGDQVEEIVFTAYKILFVLSRLSETTVHGNNNEIRQRFIDELKASRSQMHDHAKTLQELLDSGATPAVDMVQRERLEERDRLRKEVEKTNAKLVKLIEKMRTLQAVISLANSSCTLDGRLMRNVDIRNDK
uniref:Uncharacterized protein n=1 Tax=Lotharella globosa TaxID=91324 RepID=A0A7S4DYF3_9EUKA